MKKIQGLAETIRQFLGRAKCAIDYYQRENRWQSDKFTDEKIWDPARVDREVVS